MQASNNTVLTLPVSGPALTSLFPDLPQHLGISWPNRPCQNWMLLVSSLAHSTSAPVSPVTQPALPDYIQHSIEGVNVATAIAAYITDGHAELTPSLVLP